ncbi:MAG: 2-oxo acid dehydrogenase subunit E2 [Candidatus Cloacimonetes bacterium]|nr:2-oxo acid dehydrogenase subunit E2 [Candidatus Cloacimonadota bacterium]
MSIFTVLLPDIGEGVVEGEVIKWLKNVGDALAQDEPVVQIMTDKATVELPAVKPGKLAKQHIAEGKIAEKDKPLYDIELAAGVSAPQDSHGHKEAPKQEAQVSEKPQATKATASAPVLSATGKALATPATRKLARDLGIDINQVPGTGKGGRVTKEDLEGFLSGESDSAPVSSEARSGNLPAVTMSKTPVFVYEGDERIPLRGLRKVIAERLVESKTIVPHFAYFEEVDMTELKKLRNELKPLAEEAGAKLTYLPFFMKALTLAIKKFPIINSSIDLGTNEIVVHKKIHIGMATATKDGLIVPVIRDADQKSLIQLANDSQGIAQKTRDGKASSDELKGSTISITNIGSIGGLGATPIINYPEACILGMYKIQDRPVVRDGQIVIRSMMNISFCFDHRIVDGANGAEFCNYFIGLLNNPGRLILGS